VLFRSDNADEDCVDDYDYVVDYDDDCDGAVVDEADGDVHSSWQEDDVL
jgi:hypothetical protein